MIVSEIWSLTVGVDNIVGTSGNDTITATNAAAPNTVLGGLDMVDGGAGTDTLSIADTATAAAADFALPVGFTVKNVEVMNVTTNGAIGKGGATDFDISGFSGLTAFTGIAAGTGSGTGSQIKAADTTNVTLTVAGTDTATIAGGKEVTVTAGTGVVAVSGTKLEAVTVKGGNLNAANSIDNGTATTLKAVTLDNIAAGAAATIRGNGVETLTIKNQDSAVDAQITNATSKALTVKLDNAGYDSTGAAVASVDFTPGAAAETVTVETISKSNVTINAGVAVKAVSFTGAGDLVLAGLGALGTVTSIDGAAATGGLTLGTLNAATTTVTTGSGKDSLQLAATAKATVTTGAGNDTVTIGAALNKDSTINLGDGDDKVLNAAGTVSATNTVDGGAGTDTLALTLVGAANVAAFKNFEVFDAVGLNATLDTDILAANNTVTEFVASGAVGAAASLTNLAANVGVRVTGDMDANDLSVTQKAAGSLKVTHDIDETGTTAATTAAADVLGTVTATNATSIDVVFDSTFVGDATGAGDNVTQLALTASKATSITIASDGNAVINDFNLTGGDDATALKGDLLTSVTVTGSQKLDFGYTAIDATEIMSVNASASTGGLVINLDAIKDTGTVTLGSGDDTITAQAVAADAATAIAEHVKVAGIEKGSAEDLTSVTGLDTIAIAGAIQAADNAVGDANASVLNGLITFKGAGPATLTDAVTFVQGLIGANESAVFEYVGNSFIFSEGATNDAGDDILIELTGTTGLAGLDTVAANTLYVF